MSPVSWARPSGYVTFFVIKSMACCLVNSFPLSSLRICFELHLSWFEQKNILGPKVDFFSGCKQLRQYILNFESQYAPNSLRKDNASAFLSVEVWSLCFRLLFCNIVLRRKYVNTSAATVGINNSILSIFDGWLVVTEALID